MKYKLLSPLCLSVCVLLPFTAKADTPVASFGTPPTAYGSCAWTLTSSSGGGGAPQFYTLNCSGTSNVVGLMTVGGGSSATCTITSAVKSGYVAVGSGCATQINKK